MDGCFYKPSLGYLEERNRVVFYDTPLYVDRLKFSFISSLSSWARLIANEDFSFVRILLCIL